MSVVRTDLRNTRESARRIRFEPIPGLPATDVQTAIVQATTAPPVVNPTNVSVTPYPVQASDFVLFVDTSAGPIVIQLQPSAARGNTPLEVIDVTGQAETNNISVLPSGAETVDGLSPYPININYGTLRIYPKASGGWTTAP